MRRRTVRLVIVLLAACGRAHRPAIVGSVGEPVRTLTPPVADDCSADVTPQLNAWLRDEVKDGDTISFAPNGCYVLNNTFLFVDRRDITLDGNGATLKATADAPLNVERARLQFELGGGFVVRNLTVQGTNTADCAPLHGESCYESRREHDANIRTKGSHGLLVEHVVLKNTWGDGLEVFPGGHWDSEGAGATLPENITLRDSVVDTAGRHGVSVSGAKNLALVHNSFTNIGYWVIDVELEANAWSADVLIDANTFGHFRFGFLASATGTGVMRGPFVITNNIQTSRPPTCWEPIIIGQTNLDVGSMTITGNRLQTLSDGITLSGRSVPNVSIRSNTIDFLSGGSCGRQRGIHAVNVAAGSIDGNVLIGFQQPVVTERSSVTVCDNRNTPAGPSSDPCQR